jgi:hypothetical protein
MLREVPTVAQDAPGLTRRWFRDEYFDLYLWEKPGGAIEAFQLCYDRADHERSLRWSAGKGFLHEGVDRPEMKPGRSMTAILVAAGAFAVAAVSRKFLHAAKDMPRETHDFLMGKLAEYAKSMAHRAPRPPDGAGRRATRKP